MTKDDSGKNKKIIRADRVSGLEGCAFALSVCVRVIELGNKRVKFKFPFWAFSVPADSNHGTEWISNEGYNRESERILKSIEKPAGLAYFNKIKNQIAKEEIILEKAAGKLCNSLSSLNDVTLANAYEKFIEQYSYYYGLGIVTFLYEGILSEKLMQSLLSRYPDAAKDLPSLFQGDYLSFMFRSEHLLAEIKKEKKIVLKQKLIEKYKRDFFYIRTNYWHGPLVNEAFIKQQVANLKVSKPQTINVSKLKLLSWEKKVISLLKINEAIRDKRKQINVIGSYVMFRFLDEIVRRRGIKLNLVKRAFWFEFSDLLMDTKKILPQLKKRHNICVGYDGGRSFYLDYLAVKENIAPPVANEKISGTPAASGFYQGVAHLVMSGQDFKKFKNGEVLVTTMTRPEFLPVMKKAGAIVTDEGGLTCHAAIVAREMKIPCVIGTKMATRLLKNGDLVEVDAIRGTIKVIKSYDR